MSNSIKDFTVAFENLPKLLSAKDLVDIGLFTTIAACHKSHQRKTAPPSIKLAPNKLRFPKKDFIEWLSKKTIVK